MPIPPAARLLAPLWLGVLACSSAAVAQEPAVNRFSLEDLSLLSRLSMPALSPDGHWAALVVSQPDPQEDRLVDALVLIDTGTGAVRRIAEGRIKDPAFSPLGERLAWLAEDGSETPQLVVATLGGEAQAPVRVTNVSKEAPVQRFAWSPDGRTFGYLAREAPAAPIGEARFDRSFEISDSDYLGTSYLDRTAGPAPTRLWVVSAHGGVARELSATSDTIEEFAWGSDGKTLFFNRHPGTSIVAERFGTIGRLDIAGGGEAVVVAAPANVATEAQMRVSSNGALGYLTYRGQDPWLFNHNVAIVREGAVVNLTEPLDQDITSFGWLASGRALLASGFDHEHTALWEVPLEGPVRRVKLGAVELEDFTVAAASDSVAFVGSESNRPPELYIMRSADALPRRLTHFHDALGQKRWGKVEAIRWQGDGFEHTGVVTYPPDFRSDRRYPLLVHIHGGPHTSATLAFSGIDQVFAAAGWVVLKPNYRGSSGQGERYRTAVIGDATAGPGRDIFGGVRTLQARGFIDPERVAVTGYSYGGVLSSWMIGHYHDWCAAIPGGVVVDFTDYYDQSNTGIWIDSLLGSPHLPANRASYIEQSPVTYLAQANTPTLVLQNVGDPNAGVTQAYALFHALRDRGVKSRLVLFGVDGHGLDEHPLLDRKSVALTLSWMEQNCTKRYP